MNTTNIEKGTYEGYIWMSDKDKPEKLEDKDFEYTLNPNINPFIIEAQLFDKKQCISYSIKYVDGQYVVNKYKIESTDFNQKDIVIKSYLSNNIDSNLLHFLQYWRSKKDPLCLDMEVLEPAELVFVGFKI